MSTAVMSRRTFDTRGNLADQLFRCLETPYSDFLEHNTVPATKSPGQRIFPLAWFRFCPSQVGVESVFEARERPLVGFLVELRVPRAALSIIVAISGWAFPRV
jgi:hypothetical protein